MDSVLSNTCGAGKMVRLNSIEGVLHVFKYFYFRNCFVCMVLFLNKQSPFTKDKCHGERWDWGLTALKDSRDVSIYLYLFFSNRTWYNVSCVHQAKFIAKNMYIDVFALGSERFFGSIYWRRTLKYFKRKSHKAVNVSIYKYDMLDSESESNASWQVH